MLTVHHVSKSYGIETVLKDISFSLNAGERLGLVGPNGCGKTTLLRILAGEDRPDSGSVALTSPHARVGYLPQGFTPSPEDSLGGFLSEMGGDLTGLSRQVEELATALAAEPGRADLQAGYDQALAGLEAAAESAGRGPAVLAALGLEGFPPDTPIAHLSGGQKTRLALAGILLAAPQVLLLDEPTNHLDFEMLAWLENWLLAYSGAILVVSHDRAFLDRAATGILEIDPAGHTLRAYAGNYTDYLEQKLADLERQNQAYVEQQKEIDGLRHAIRRVRSNAAFKKGGKGDSGDKFAKGFFANRTKETIRRAKSLEKRLEKLLTEDRLDRPRASWQMKLEFGETPQSGKDVFSLEDLTVGYPTHQDAPPGGDGSAGTTLPEDPLVLLAHLDLHARLGERIALVGPNGSGKSTLVRTLAGRLEPLGGRVRLGANVRIGYMAQEQENLDPAIDAFTALRRAAPFSETEARTFLHLFLFTGDEVFVPVGSLSYGERARLTLACLVAQGSNLLLLDEPVNHLDLPSRARFEQALETFQGTVLAVVHDRYFIEGFATTIWEVQPGERSIHVLR